MAFGKTSKPGLEADDLSSISCISLHVPLEEQPKSSRAGGQERFENEFDVSAKKELSSIPVTPGSERSFGSRRSAPPTELFLPVQSRNIGSHDPLPSSCSPSWCKIPYLRQYPPILRALFVICFICILCAIGLIVFAVVVQARGAPNSSSSTRSFDANNWGTGSSDYESNNNNNRGDSPTTAATTPTAMATPTPPQPSDIFVDGNDSDGGHDASNPTVPSPSPPPPDVPTGPVFSTPAPTRLPQTNMAKKKHMGMNKTIVDKEEKEEKDDVDGDKDEKDDDRRNRKRQRRASEMRPSIYPERRR